MTNSYLWVLTGIAKAGFNEPSGLTVSVPSDKVDIDNLTRLLDAKGDLIRKALGVGALPVEVGEGAVSFPWFNELPDTDTVNAYTHFISALCRMSREQKRINSMSRDVDNEKYAFRCLLLRLGFIGDAYKTERISSGGTSPAPPRYGMKFPSKATVARVREEYFIGTRMELVRMDDVQAPPVGTLGTVCAVDDAGSLGVRWDNGSGLNVVLGEDIVRKIIAHRRCCHSR